MRFAILVILFAAPAFAQDRFVERTPPLKKPIEHSMTRAGNPIKIAWWAQPSVGKHDATGYIGGGSLKGNSVLAKGHSSATGPTDTGTFGSDFAGFHLRMGRVFLAPSADPGRGPSITCNYRTDGPHVPDVFALRPLRKAVLEKKEDIEKRRGGEE
jgi:hypothetical protein